MDDPRTTRCLHNPGHHTWNGGTIETFEADLVGGLFVDSLPVLLLLQARYVSGAALNYHPAL